MKDQIEGASVLKHVEATKDTSAPKIERIIFLSFLYIDNLNLLLQ